MRLPAVVVEMLLCHSSEPKLKSGGFVQCGHFTQIRSAECSQSRTGTRSEPLRSEVGRNSERRGPRFLSDFRMCQRPVFPSLRLKTWTTDGRQLELPVNVGPFGSVVLRILGHSACCQSTERAARAIPLQIHFRFVAAGARYVAELFHTSCRAKDLPHPLQSWFQHQRHNKSRVIGDLRSRFLEKPFRSMKQGRNGPRHERKI